MPLYKNKRRTQRKRNIRPIPILIAGILIAMVWITIATLFFGTIAYLFHLNIENFSMISTLVYITAIYLSSLVVGLSAGHRYIELPLLNGFICLLLSLSILALYGKPIMVDLLPKTGLVLTTSFAAYLTVKIPAMLRKTKKQRVSLREKNRSLQIR